jgi:hypothetical protein
VVLSLLGAKKWICFAVGIPLGIAAQAIGIAALHR